MPSVSVTTNADALMTFLAANPDSTFVLARYGARRYVLRASGAEQLLTKFETLPFTPIFAGEDDDVEVRVRLPLIAHTRWQQATGSTARVSIERSGGGEVVGLIIRSTDVPGEYQIGITQYDVRINVNVVNLPDNALIGANMVSLGMRAYVFRRRDDLTQPPDSINGLLPILFRAIDYAIANNITDFVQIYPYNYKCISYYDVSNAYSTSVNEPPSRFCSVSVSTSGNVRIYTVTCDCGCTFSADYCLTDTIRGVIRGSAYQGVVPGLYDDIPFEIRPEFPNVYYTPNRYPGPFQLPITLYLGYRIA